jgi:hypothetical protein
MGLRVKLSDELQYEVEEYRAVVPVHPGIRSLKGTLASNKEQECLSPKSAKPPLMPCVRANIAFAIGSSGVEIRRVTIPSDALSRYKGTKAHFVDCLIAATAVAKNVPISTCDQDFRKFGDVRVETE